jgi:exopolyphosphatase/guanosine-5'-triphosphate,3'-diphosphate pyrophosphatase
MLKASLDIGSNSCFFCLAEVNDNLIEKILFEDFVITGLGEGIKSSKLLLKENLSILYNFLKTVVGKCTEYNFKPSEIRAVATEASRRATNTDEMLTYIKAHFDIKVSVISAIEEAKLSSLGVALGCTQNSKISIIDLGGASTELILFDLGTFKIINTISIPLGSVLTTDFLKSEGVSAVDRQVSLALTNYQNDSLDYYGVAGTVTTIAAILLCPNKFDVSLIHNKKITFAAINKFLQENSGKSELDLQNLFPVVGKRAKSILGGTALLLKIMEKLNLKTITVSNFGLRHGLLLN